MTFWGLASDQVVDDDEGWVVEFHRVFDVTPKAGNLGFQSRLVPSSSLCS